MGSTPASLTAKAVIADQAGLDPIGTQLQHLEKAGVQYASSKMSAFSSQAMKELKPYNFNKHIPEPVDESDYTTDIITDGKVTGTSTNQGRKTVLESILQTDISDYREMRSKYRERMHRMYHGIIHGNIDQNIITLLEADPSYAEISTGHDPIEHIKLLRKICCKEKGIIYASNTLIHSVV